MPRRPRGEKHSADVIGAPVMGPQWSRLHPHMIMRAQVDRLARLSISVSRDHPLGKRKSMKAPGGDSAL